MFSPERPDSPHCCTSRLTALNTIDYMAIVSDLPEPKRQSFLKGEGGEGGAGVLRGCSACSQIGIITANQ